MQLAQHIQADAADIEGAAVKRGEVEVGTGRRSPESFATLLAGGARAQ